MQGAGVHTLIIPPVLLRVKAIETILQKQKKKLV
jgi:hypothetical protein